LGRIPFVIYGTNMVEQLPQLGCWRSDGWPWRAAGQTLRPRVLNMAIVRAWRARSQGGDFKRTVTR